MLTLRRLQDTDISQVATWIRQSYVAEWFGEAQGWLQELEGRTAEFAFIHHFIVELDGAAIGFCQYYNHHQLPLEAQEEELPPGAFGIDYLIGEQQLLHQGLGKQLISLIVDAVVHEQKQVSCIVADPIMEEDHCNIASIKALEANQFTYDEHTNLYRREILAVPISSDTNQ